MTNMTSNTPNQGKREPLNEMTAFVAPSFDTAAGFDLCQRQANALKACSMIPESYQKNYGDVLIAVEMAGRMKVNPLMVMQNMYIVKGNPTWSSKFLIACANSCGRYSSIAYEAEGSPREGSYKIRAWAIEKSTGTRLNGSWIDWQMVKGEGWDRPKGSQPSKWGTMPEQMFMYRAAAFWVRAYAPEIGMGFLTQEEAIEIDRTPEKPVRAERVSNVYEVKSEIKGESAAEKIKELEKMEHETLKPAAGSGAQVIDTDTGEIVDYNDFSPTREEAYAAVRG